MSDDFLSLDLEGSEERRQAKHYLYCIRCGPYFKVGIAENLTKRLNQLQSATPFKLKVVMYRRVPAAHKRFVEKHIHTQLSEHWMKNEWFNATLGQIKQAAKIAVAAVPSREQRYQNFLKLMPAAIEAERAKRELRVRMESRIKKVKLRPRVNS